MISITPLGVTYYVIYIDICQYIFSLIITFVIFGRILLPKSRGGSGLSDPVLLKEEPVPNPNLKK